MGDDRITFDSHRVGHAPNVNDANYRKGKHHSRSDVVKNVNKNQSSVRNQSIEDSLTPQKQMNTRIGIRTK